MNEQTTNVPESTAPQGRGLRHPALRWALGLAGAIGVAMLAAALWLPRWIHDRGLSMASEAIGRRLSVERVQVQPWRLGLVLEGVKLEGAAAQQAPLLEIERVDASLSLASVWHRALVLGDLDLHAPTLQLTRKDATHFDIDDLRQRWSQPREAGSTSTTPVILQRVRVRDGRWLFDDRALAKQHALSALEFELPRLSLRTQDADEPLQMRLSGQLDGAPFTAELRGLVMAARRQFEAQLKIDGAELPPWLAYAGASLPVRLERGRLAADLKVHYDERQGDSSPLNLSGTLALSEVSLAQRSQAGWLGWKNLRLTMRDVQPMAQRVDLDALELEQPWLRLQRDRQGNLRVPGMAAEAQVDASPPAKSPGWQIALDRFAMQGGSLSWRDEALPVAAELSLEQLTVQGRRLRWPLVSEPAGKGSIELSAQLRAPADGKPGQVKAQLALDADRLEAQGLWRDLALQTFSPWLQSRIPLSLRGIAAGQWRYAAAKPLQNGALARGQLSLSELSAEALQARMAGAAEFASIARLTLDRAEIDLQAQRVMLGRLDVAGPQLQLRRSAGGDLMLPLPATREGTGSAVPSPQWALLLDELAVDKGRLLLSDASVQPLQRRSEDGLHRLQADAIQLRVSKLALDGQGAKLAAAPVRLSLQLSQPGSRRDGAIPGRLSWNGQLGTAPWSLRGQLNAERLPLYALSPYLDRSLHIHLRRGEAAFKGQLNFEMPPQGWRGRLRGELSLDDLRLQHVRGNDGQLQAGEDFLSWRELDLAGLDLGLAAGLAPSIQIGKASLADFYARLIVDERGHFNLGELRSQPAAAAAPAASSPAAGPASAPAPAASAPLILSIGETQLAGGTVDFSDRYIKPNYSAKLSEMAGTLGRFSSGDSAMAPLRLSGRIEGTGQLTIYGELNPSGAPLAMDIHADASDIELSPLSPYAGKYAGYAIERGKLSSHVHYKIDPGGLLEAQNQIILNQLTFGERIESPSATKLPVLLAVALLKDRNGVIDINLPISGSLRDPQFSMGGLIVKIIVNLIGKALTAPFALLTGGGAAEHSQIDFAAGSALVDAAALARLDKIASALQDRPGLNLTLTGWAQPEAEHAGMQAQALDRALQAERRRELRRQGGAQSAAQQSESVVVAPSDRPRLLAQLYKASNLPDRPRNFLGLLKDVPAEEMEQRLLAGYEIKREAVVQLALSRAVALRDVLIARGVPQERIFLAAPKLAESDAVQAWTPKVELSLATR